MTSEGRQSHQPSEVQGRNADLPPTLGYLSARLVSSPSCFDGRLTGMRAGRQTCIPRHLRLGWRPPRISGDPRISQCSGPTRWPVSRFGLAMGCPSRCLDIWFAPHPRISPLVPAKRPCGRMRALALKALSPTLPHQGPNPCRV